MYIMNIMGNRWENIVEIERSGLSYEMRVIRSVNKLHINNLGPSGIGGTPMKFR
jgi:hypothetical protein